MDARIPTPIHDLLHDYCTLLESKVPGFVTGLYLHGSIALGAFHENRSDIDFIAFLSRRATIADVEQLRSIHHTIATKYPRWLVEGSYLQWDELGCPEESITPSPVHHDNKFDANGKFDVNSVTWWVLKHHGIALIGPQPQELTFDVDWDLLIANMHQNMNSYWAGFIRKPQRIVWLLSDFGVEWTVLGTLRQYYSFVAHDITSKTGAGDYALNHLPAHWHRIIGEALRIREQAPNSLYNSKLKRAGEAYNFLRFIINYCNSLAT
jgi:hypothetical protein